MLLNENNVLSFFLNGRTTASFYLPPQPNYVVSYFTHNGAQNEGNIVIKIAAAIIAIKNV